MFENEYRETFSRVTASQETVMEVLNLKKQNERRIYKAPRLALVIAMVLLLTACAVGFNAWDMLDAAFGENGQANVGQEKIYNHTDEDGNVWYLQIPSMDRVDLDEELAKRLVEPYVVQVSESATHSEDGTVLTVEAYLNDPSTKTCIVYLNIENPNGLPAYDATGTGWLHWDRETVGLHYLLSEPFGYYFLDTTRSTDTKQYLTLRLAYKETLSELKIRFTQTDDTLILPISDSDIRSISMNNGDIIISPVSMYLKAGVFSLSTKEMVITYQDGSEYVLADTSIKKVDGKYQQVKTQNFYLSFALDEEYKNCSFSLNRIVELDNVKSLIIDGTEYFPD